MNGVDWKKTFQPVADAMGWDIDKLMNWAALKFSQKYTADQINKMCFDIARLNGKTLVFKGSNEPSN